MKNLVLNSLYATIISLGVIASSAFASTVDQSCYTTFANNRYGTNSEISITAKCDIDFSKGGSINFTGDRTANVWGNMPGGWMDWKMSQTGYTYTPESWSGPHKLLVGQTMTLNYTGSDAAKNISITAGYTPPTPVASGSVNVVFPNSPSGVMTPPSFNLMAESTGKETFNTAKWGANYKVSNLILGKYYIKLNNYCDANSYNCYSGVATPSSFTLTKTALARKVTVKYNLVPQIAVNLSISGLTNYADKIKLTITSADGSNTYIREVTRSSRLFNVPEGSYKVSSTSVVEGTSVFHALPVSLVVSGNTTNSLMLDYVKSTNKSIPFIGYLGTWSEKWTSDPKTLELANVDPHVNVIELSFVDPSAPLTLNGAGSYLQYSSSPEVIKQAIEIAHSRGQKVLLAVGGASFASNWSRTNYEGIKQLVSILGADGVDIDYEGMMGLSCDKNTKSCPTDQELTNIIKKFRTTLPSKIITASVWSVGAQDFGSVYLTSGSWINPLKSAGSDIDEISIMSYDVLNTRKNPGNYDPILEADRYQNIYSNPISIGLETGMTIDGVEQSASYIKKMACNAVTRTDGKRGIMLWTINDSDTPYGTKLNAPEIIRIVSGVIDNPSQCSN